MCLPRTDSPFAENRRWRDGRQRACRDEAACQERQAQRKEKSGWSSTGARSPGAGVLRCPPGWWDHHRCARQAAALGRL